MIVRILSDNQYQLDDRYKPAIAELDERLLEAVEQDDQAAFEYLFYQLVRLIQENGQPIPPRELVTSDVILPAPDMTMQEVQDALKTPILAYVGIQPH
jgi:hypothetical protein